MTLEEEEIIYRILFEDSDEDCPSAIYEVYDTLDEILESKAYLPHISYTLQ